MADGARALSTQFMQLYVGDYLRDTRHLTAEQHGAYLLLLMSMWAHGGELPNDPKKLARLACCTASRWTKISDDVLEFFDIEGDIITQARLRVELKKALEKSIKRAEAGMRGGDAKALKDKSAELANASRLPCHYPEPEPDTEGKPSVGGAKKPRTKSVARLFPTDWMPSDFDRAYAREQGLTDVEIDRAVEDFRDHFIAAGNKRSTDWSLNWKRWCRTTADRKPRRFAGMAGQPATGYRGRQDTSLAEIAARRQREREAEMDVSGEPEVVSGPDLGWADGAIDGIPVSRFGQG